MTYNLLITYNNYDSTHYDSIFYNFCNATTQLNFQLNLTVKVNPGNRPPQPSAPSGHRIPTPCRQGIPNSAQPVGLPSPSSWNSTSPEYRDNMPISLFTTYNIDYKNRYRLI